MTPPGFTLNRLEEERGLFRAIALRNARHLKRCT